MTFPGWKSLHSRRQRHNIKVKMRKKDEICFSRLAMCIVCSQSVVAIPKIKYYKLTWPGENSRNKSEVGDALF